MYCPVDKYKMLRVAIVDNNEFGYYCQYCDIYRDANGNVLPLPRHSHKNYHEKQLEKRVAELESKIKKYEKERKEVS